MSTGESTPNARVEADRAAMLHLITAPAGFEVSLFAELWVYRLQDGRFSVNTKRQEFLYDDPSEAVDFYLELRELMQLGLDHEYIPESPFV